MDAVYYVVLRIKTSEGFESYGRFSLGNDSAKAHEIFDMLKGSHDVDESNSLQVDFVEFINEVPVTLRIIACTVEELSINIRIITKEIFKLFNLL